MKKLYFIMLITFLTGTFFNVSGQNMVQNGGLEQWTDPITPTNWDLSENISQESTNVHSGEFAARQLSASSSKKFRQDIGGIVPGQQYTISYYFLDNVDNAKTRIWSYWMDAEGTYLDDDADILRPADYSENNANWQMFETVLIAPANAAQFRFEVRTYHQDNNVDGYIYFDDFYLSGEQTNYPEPSNYPTEFMAEEAGLNINLTWVDAIGEQLPTGYLILGEILIVKDAAWEVPVDGVPVPDDLDWSDGMASVNVAYGQEMYLFSNLSAGTDYNFVIYPYTNSGENIDYKTDGIAPDAGGSVGNVVTINFTDFESGSLAPWMQYSVVGAQIWEPYDFSGDKFARMSGYEGASNANEDWLISPNLYQANMIEVNFSFISAYNYAGNPLTLHVSNDYDGSGDPNDFNWTDISDEAVWSGGSWVWTESGTIDITDYFASPCYLAFRYTSTTEESSTWELDDLFVFGTSSVGIDESKTANISMYPNPASQSVYFNLPAKGNLSIYNLAGQLVFETGVQQGKQEMNISEIHTGLYIVKFIGDDQSMATTKLTIK